MHSELRLLKLQDRRNIHLQFVNHKNIHSRGCLSQYLHRRVGLGVHRTKHMNEFTHFVPRLKTNKGRYAYSYRGPCSWNKVDEELKRIESFDLFKSRLMRKVSPMFDNHPT